MQYVRSLGGSVSKTWNSINPATLSGAIDVIVVQQEDGSLACSPFHVRFGKFSLLRPFEKKVEFKVNDVKQNYAMKLGEGGEAFFVFETSDAIPESLQTSPVISPTASPQSLFEQNSITPPPLQEPEFLDLNINNSGERRPIATIPADTNIPRVSRLPPYLASLAQISDGTTSQEEPLDIPTNVPHIKRSASEELLSPDSTVFDEVSRKHAANAQENAVLPKFVTSPPSDRSASPPPLSAHDAVDRARVLSKKLSISNIRSKITEKGDLMLDMTGYKSSEDDALRTEIIARKILAEELKGNYDIGALIGADEQGNLWIYSSEEAKEAAARSIGLRGIAPGAILSDAASDPGFESDEEHFLSSPQPQNHHQRSQSESVPAALVTPPQTPPNNDNSRGESSRNYAKTLRLTSDQLKALKLKPGLNSMSFSVNKATCQANMYYWKHDVPVVISDIDGTITKSDALGHVLNMIGRDWTHLGVAKLYSDIVANGYHILYLTSRSVGQADTTRTYLNGVVQEGFKLPKGPVIMSPDRTIAALRREIYLQKPEVFKMACLRDILSLFNKRRDPFYAGFGNRLTDALSYRSVNIPSTRIFTINSNAEVSLDLLTLNKYKSSYVTMRDVVDQFFPPVGLLITSGGEEFTDFSYWREPPPEIDDFSDSDSEDRIGKIQDKQSIRSEDEGSEGVDDDEDDDQDDELAMSYSSHDSIEAGADEMIDSVIDSIENNELVPQGPYEAKELGKQPDAVLEIGLESPVKEMLDNTTETIATKGHMNSVKLAQTVRANIDEKESSDESSNLH